MDPATAALFGATIGLSGTLIAPLVSSYQTKRTKAQDLMREAYARGFACLARIPRCETRDDHLKLRDKMLDALAHIEMVGTKKTSELYSDVIESFTAWKIDGEPNSTFALKAKMFQQEARADSRTSESYAMSTPAILLRLIVPLVALSIYWTLRFPVLARPVGNSLDGLEIGVALFATSIGLCFAGDATLRFNRLLRQT
ncbi:hypothetical protein [Amycolatopsis japonica]